MNNDENIEVNNNNTDQNNTDSNKISQEKLYVSKSTREERYSKFFHRDTTLPVKIRNHNKYYKVTSLFFFYYKENIIYFKTNVHILQYNKM